MRIQPQVNMLLTYLPCWNVTLPSVVMLHNGHGMLDVMMNIVMSMMACVMGHHHALLTLAKDWPHKILQH